MSEQIFLSYQRDDYKRAQPVAETLIAAGWTVYWDRETPVGQTWEDVIDKKVEAAGCLVVLWSEKSIRSKWVRIEAAEADDKRILVPAVIDDKLKLPIRFRRKQNAKLYDWDGNPSNHEFQKLTRAIAGLLGYPEGSRKKLGTVRNYNRRELTKEIKRRGFEKSPRSEQIFYHGQRSDLRICFRKTRVRLEQKSSGNWKMRRSYGLERPIDIVLQELHDLGFPASSPAGT